ncbi:MAG TPA: magnesium transporter [Intrasporangium sp.]|nr:magnesium transporter [Intrasporangium sp.]
MTTEGDALPGAPGESPTDQPLLPGTISDYLAAEIAVCGPLDRAGDIRSGLAGRALDTVDDIAVCTGRAPRLVGLIPASRLFAAEAGTTAAEIMDADPPVVSEGLDEEKAAWKAVEHGESSLAVVDAQGRFLGLVPPRRLLAVLLSAHDQDFARLGGYLRSTDSARVAAEEPLQRRLVHRLPWLAAGLVGAAFSAWLLGQFEGRLSDDVRLAFFIPGIVYLADAVGTQTEALIIRGLSVGAPFGTAMRLEVITGPMIGILLGLVCYPAVWLVLDSPELALTVSLSLVVACSMATFVAVALPWLMTRSGKDPAFGSGPLATVVQDLVSLLAYVAVATLVVF